MQATRFFVGTPEADSNVGAELRDCDTAVDITVLVGCKEVVAKRVSCLLTVGHDTVVGCDRCERTVFLVVHLGHFVASQIGTRSNVETALI